MHAVQALLNRAGALGTGGHALSVDNKAGITTLAAIKEYQTRWTKFRDGKIDPHGMFARKLVEVADEFQLVVATVVGEAGNGRLEGDSLRDHEPR